VGVLALVEHIPNDGEPLEVKCWPATAAARALRRQQEALLLVSEYSHDPVQVRVEYTVPAGMVVEDAESAEAIPAGRTHLMVKLRSSRARLLWVHAR
jgi:hypothetical protein